MARPTILTDDLIARIVDLVRLGNYPLVAARACGVGDNTFYDWLARGREANGTVPDRSKKAKARNQTSRVEVIDQTVKLVNGIAEAEALCEARAVGTIVVAANADHKAAVTFLERRHAQRWRQHVSTEMTGPDGGPIQSQVEVTAPAAPIDETLAGILEAMARAGKLPKEA
jgi:transposase-like protein